MRFLVALSLSWCTPGLAAKSLASLGLLKAGSKLSAFQKYTDEVVARFLQHDAPTMSSDQRTAINTVKAYLKAMVWGEEGIWHMHLRDLEKLENFGHKCIADHKEYHVSAFCNMSTANNGVVDGECRCNGQLGNLEGKMGHGSAKVSQTHGSQISQNLSNINHDGTRSYFDKITKLSNGKYASWNQSFGATGGESSIDYENTVDTADMVIAANNHVQYGHNSIAAFDTEDATSQEKFKTGGHVIDDALMVKYGDGDGLWCADEMHLKIKNLRELRRVAELTYRRMHICHSEKAQEFWLAGSNPTTAASQVFGGGVADVGDRTAGFCKQYSEYRSAELYDCVLTGDCSGSQSTTIKLHSFPSCAMRQKMNAMVGTSTLRGTPVQRTKYTEAEVTKLKDEVKEKTTYSDGLYSFHAVDSVDESYAGFHRGTTGTAEGGKTHFGIANDLGIGTHSGDVIKIGYFEGSDKVKYSYGDLRCVAQYTQEHGMQGNDGTVRTDGTYPAANKVYMREKFEQQKDKAGADLLTSEVLVPRTCLMWGSGFLDKETDGDRGEKARSGHQSASHKLQCDEWFRDCTANVILRDRVLQDGDTLKTDNTDQRAEATYSTSNLDHFWSVNVTTDSLNSSYWLELNGGARTHNGSTGVWTQAEGFGYGDRTDGSHVAAHCTQRKPLWSPLLQSCSYVANYNSWPPAAQIGLETARTYLDDEYITTSIASAREDMETCLEEVRAWFDPMWTHYALCRRGEGIGNDKNLCKSELEEWESAVCVYLGRQEELCGWLSGCLAEEDGNCENERSDIQARVAARKVDYESSQRIECLLEAVTNFGESCVCDGLCTPRARFEAGYTQSDPEGKLVAADANVDLGGDPATTDANPAFAYDTPPTAEAAVDYSSSPFFQEYFKDTSSQPTPWTIPFALDGVDTTLDKTDYKFRTYDQLMEAECQTYYTLRKQEAIDRCMVSMPLCNPQTEDSSQCPEGFIYDTYDGTGNAKTTTDAENPSLGWMLDTFGFPSRFYRVKDDAGGQSYTADANGVVTLTCSRSRLQMTACVNGVYDLPDGQTTYTSGGKTYNMRNHLDMQHRLHKIYMGGADLQSWMDHYNANGNTQSWSSTQSASTAIRTTILEHIPAATEWDVLAGATATRNPAWCRRSAADFVNLADADTPQQAGGVCSQVDSRSFLSEGSDVEYPTPVQSTCDGRAEAAAQEKIRYWYAGRLGDSGTDTDDVIKNGKPEDDEWKPSKGTATDKELCEANNRNVGKIHMDTSIWDITPLCSNYEDLSKDHDWTIRKEECPQFNQCEGPSRVQWTADADIKDGLNSPLQERYFWQVPSKAEVQTYMGSGVSYECVSVADSDGDGTPACNALKGTECGKNDAACDASYSRIYLAGQPGQTLVTECDKSTFFKEHYLKDNGVNRSVDGDAAEHLVCRDGAAYKMKKTFWRQHLETAVQIFPDKDGAGAQNCDAIYGGPTDGYAAKLAGWLHYRSGATYGVDNAAVEQRMVGKHCFMTNPCASTKQLVPFHTAYTKVECTGDAACTSTTYDYEAANLYYCEDAPTGTAYPFQADGTASACTDSSGNGACSNEKAAYDGGYRG